MHSTPEGFAERWEVVAPWLAEALTYSGSNDTIADVKQAVMEGGCQLFVHPTGAAVTMIERHATVPTLRIWLAGGNMDAMQALVPDFETVARVLGCEQLVFLGRTGWQRTFLTEVGFKAVAVEMVKRLPPEVPNE